MNVRVVTKVSVVLLHSKTFSSWGGTLVMDACCLSNVCVCVCVCVFGGRGFAENQSKHELARLTDC